MITTNDIDRYFLLNKCGSGHRKLRVCVIKKPLRSSLIFYFSHRLTNKRTNTMPENIYLVYSRRSTAFAFICGPNSLFLTIFDIFSRDRQTDRQTDRPTDKGRHRSSEPGALKHLLCVKHLTTDKPRYW